MGWNPLAAPTLAIFFGACLSLGVASQDRDWAKSVKEAKLSLSEAIDKAGALAKDGVPVHAELEEDKGKTVYSIDVAQGQKNVAIVIDAKTGGVIENETEDEDHSPLVKTARISLKQAIEKALLTAQGTAVEAQLVLLANKPVVQVKILADGKLQTVAVDGATGTARAVAAGAEEQASDKKFTEHFPPVEAGDWASTGSNAFLVLEPGYKLVLEGQDKGKHVVLIVTVLAETKKVDGVETRVVEERESADGQVVEVSRNYWAISKKTSNVYYFGEDVDMYQDGKVVDHEGTWHSGVNGARYGLFLPGTPLVGARYYQEVAPGVAMDRAEIVSLDEKFECPAGKFERCLKTEETTPLEKGAKEYKIHAPGIGLVLDGALKLTKYGKEK